MIPLPNTANRLALGLMVARGFSDYEEAVQELERLSLRLVCDARIAQSAALQAALLTALNCGQRAFLGGVQIEMPENVPLLLAWPCQMTLNGVVAELMGRGIVLASEATQTLHFGFRPANPCKHSLTVNATGWRGGIEPSSTESQFAFCADDDFALGGIFAGALGVLRGFLRSTAISVFACDESAGLSLWDEDADWLAASSAGPALRALPESLWLLGLGHLGQAFLWTLGLLPFADPSKCEIMLQDFDRIEDANTGSGLLSTDKDIGDHKARVCARWLEARSFRTTVCERAFDENTKRKANEPAIALCGFDKPGPRQLLEGANFARIIECGLGANIHDFDLIHIHNFPGRCTAAEIWKHAAVKPGRPNPQLVEALSPGVEVCGALAIEVAGKAVSTSFVGAMASAAVFGELLRAYHKGQKHDELYLSTRNLADCDFVRSAEFYRATHAAELGFCDVKGVT
jgi:hypothetical protein